jgi:tetratricopeptide (TPR) repeat protein
MQCAEIAPEGLLDKYLDGALDRVQRDAVEFHLRSCITCMLASEKKRAERRGSVEPAPARSILTWLRDRTWAVATVILILGAIGVFLALAQKAIRSGPTPVSVTVPTGQVSPAREALLQEISRVGSFPYLASTRPRPQPAEKRHQEAVQLYNQRSFGQAANAFREVLAIDPGDSHSWLYMGVCHAALGDLPKAEEALQKLADKPADPYYDEARFVLSKVMFGERRLDEGAQLLSTLDTPENRFGPQARNMLEIVAKLR